MFLALLAIAERIRNAAPFQSWDVRDGMTLASRQNCPAVDLRIESATVETAGTGSATVAPVITVRLIVERGEDAPVTLNRAFNAVIAELHGLRIEDSDGRRWSWLKLAGVRGLDVVDGYVGCGMTFTTDSEFSGQQCDC
jgi:hypothetical protein